MASKKINFVELSNGTTLSLEAVRERTPSTVRSTEEHILLCERVAQMATDDPSERSVYANYLITHSAILLQISSLFFLIRNRALDARRLVINLKLPNLEQLVDEKLQIETLEISNSNYLRMRTFAFFALKVCSHLAYRLTKRHLPRSKKLIRAYVDTTTKSYDPILSKSTIYVYPFKTNPFRQLRFLRNLRKNQISFSTMGLPYPKLGLFRLIGNFRNRDLALIRLEITANGNHAAEISAMKFEEVYSDSESETAGLILNQTLRNLNVITYNTFHGVGVYGPFIDFQHCVFYNPAQKQFYNGRANIDHAYFRDVVNLQGRSRPPNYSHQPKIVLLQGNWENVGKKYEHLLELRLIKILKKISLNLNLEFAIKVHPNATDRQIKRTTSQFGVSVTKHLEDKSQKGFIFINTLSTAYYAFLSKGPVLFVRDHLLNPQDIFGNKIAAIFENELPQRIEMLLCAEKCENTVRWQTTNEKREPVFQPGCILEDERSQ